MAVETRYVVIRNNIEVQIFVNKKDADDYDRLIDSADLISELLEHAPVSLTEQQREELGLYLAKNKDKLLNAFHLKKAKSTPLSEELTSASDKTSLLN